MKGVELEEERTEMADERTLLAYIRTALSIFIFGVAVHQFYPGFPYAGIVLLVSLVAGFFLLVFGIIRYFYLLRKMKS